MKKIISVILLFILTTQNVFGSTLILEDKKVLTIYYFIAFIKLYRYKK